MPTFEDPTLSLVLAEELSAGNSVVSTFRDPCDREVVQLGSPFVKDWAYELVDSAVYVSDRVDVTAVDHGEYASIHRETIETERGALVAPFPTEVRLEARMTSRIATDRASRAAEGPIPRRVLLARCADAIEADLRRAGVWRESATAAPEFRAAFGADVMPFTDWIQLVFLPRLREIVRRDAPLPGPGVGAHAVREFDGDERFVDLTRRLVWIDSLSPREAEHQPFLSARRDGKSLLVTFGFAAGLTAIALVAIGLGTWIVDRIERRGRFSSHGVLLSMQVENLASGPNGSLEIRVDARGDRDGKSTVAGLELVTARWQPFRDIVPGLRPFFIDPSRLPPEEHVVTWFLERGADSNGARADARCAIDLARSLAGASEALETARFSPPWRENGERARFPYRIGMPESLRLTIVISVLVVILVPATWFGVKAARRARGFE